VNGHKQAVYMKNGQGVDQHIIGPPAPVALQHLRIAEHVAVGQHGTFAAPSGATGVDDDGQVIRRAAGACLHVAVNGGTRQQRTLALIVQRENVACARTEGDFGHPAKVGRGTHQHRRFGVFQEIRHFGALVGGVEGQKHQPCTQGSEVQQHGLDRFVHLHRHPRARWQVQRGQEIGQSGAFALQVAPGVARAAAFGGDGFHRHAVQVCGEGCPQGRVQVVVLAVVVVLAHGVMPIQKRGLRLSIKAAMPSRCSALSA